MSEISGVGKARSRRWLVALSVALAVALALCTWQAVTILRFRDPQPTVEGRPGAPALVNGTTYRLDRLTIAERLPARRPGEPPISALPGAVLVQPVITVEVLDPARDREKVWCEFLLVDSSGREWISESDIEYDIAGPEAITCSGTWEDTIGLRDPLQVGRVFMIPKTAADDVRFRLRLGFENETIQFQR